MKADYKQLIQRLRAMRMLIANGSEHYLCDALQRASNYRGDHTYYAIQRIIAYGIGQYWSFEAWHRATTRYWPTSEEARKARLRWLDRIIEQAEEEGHEH